MKSANPPKSRTVPSRFKQAASDIAKKSTSRPNTSCIASDSGSSFENAKKKGKPSKLKGSFEISLTPCQPSFPLHKSSKAFNSNPKLHSTAVNNTVFFEKTHLESTEIFSTTVVDHRGKFQETLADLPNISEIDQTFAAQNPKPNNELKPEKKPEYLEERDYTMEEIKAEYLQYLSWVYINVTSKEIFENQVAEAEKQIFCLAQLVAEEESKLLKEQQNLQLLRHHNEVSKNHLALRMEILKLNELTDPCTKGLVSVADQLEEKFNQIKLEEVYIPDNEEKYKEKLNKSLKNNRDVLKTLNASLENCSKQLEIESKLLQDLTQEVDAVEPILKDGEKVASLAIQESSLKLSLSVLSDDSVVVEF